jgi:hypothetical protein
MKMFGIKDVVKSVYLRHFLIINRSIRYLESKAGKPLRVLDIGCGDGWYWRTGPLSDLVDSKVIELHVLEAERLDLELVNVAIPHIGSAPDALRAMKEDMFDFVTCFDVIEHFSKHDGYHLLYEIDRISKYGSAIFTPNGFIWQPPSKNNFFNAHLSGWTPKELSNLGWSKIYSAGGYRGLYGPYGVPKIRKGTLIFKIFGFAIDVLSLIHPRLGFAFLAINHQKNPRT